MKRFRTAGLAIVAQAAGLLYRGIVFESQRDSSLQPRVARDALRLKGFATLKGLTPMPQPVQGCVPIFTFTQGRRCTPTLGWRPQSLWDWKNRFSPGRRPALLFAGFACIALACTGCNSTHSKSARLNSPEFALLDPAAPKMNEPAPEHFKVRLETSKGVMIVAVHRDWSPHGADRFFNLVRAGYYNGARFFRVIAGRWAQFGVNGDPLIAQTWREQTIPDDPRRESNRRGTIAFAFAVPNGRTTQLFINLQDNSATHDAEPFVPFGEVISGMEVADTLNTEYAEAVGGIRAGRQGPLFEQGNAWLQQNFPRLDYIIRASVVKY